MNVSSKKTRKFDNLSYKIQDVNLKKLSLNQKIDLWINQLGNFSTKKEKIWNNEDLKALKVVACLIALKH